MMISYELAKELRDAGFPQPISGHYIGAGWYDKKDRTEPGVYVPALSELIDWCGHTWAHPNNPKALYTFWLPPCYENKWCAMFASSVMYEPFSKEGPVEGTYYAFSENADTPEEAVAQLGIAVHNFKPE